MKVNCLYIRIMYVCIRVGHKAGPCTATFNDLLCLHSYYNQWLSVLFLILYKFLARNTTHLPLQYRNISALSSFIQTK
jgi:hypothetical protein